LANVVSFGGTVKLIKGSSFVGPPCVVCMGTGRSNLVDSSFNILDVRHVQNSSLDSYLQITSGPFRFMIPIHCV